VRLATRIAALCALALACSTPAALAGVPAGAEWRDAYFPSGDGTMLHADVIRPAGLKDSDKTPVILSIGPYFNHAGQTAPDYNPSAEGPNTRFHDLYEGGNIFKRGYTLVQVDLRGFGASSGCNDFGGVGEQADAKAAVEWAASQPWSNGKVGMWGKSYDGWTEVMGLATKPKGLAAAVIMSPIIDGYRTLYMNGVHYDSGWYATPAIYQAGDLEPPSLFDSPQYFAGMALGTNPACYALNILQQTAFIDRDNAFWDSRNLVPRASGSSVPVLWSHGFLDANTKPDNFMDVWSTLTGPHRAWFGQYHHVRPYGDVGEDNGPEVVGKKGFIEEAMRWFDRYLKGADRREAPVEDDPVVEVEDGGISKYRAEAQWPPADVVRMTMGIHPGTHTDQQGNNATAAGGQTHGLGIWSVSQALPYDTHIAGVPKLTLDLTTSAPRINLFAILYDVNGSNKATVLSRGAAAAKGSGKIAWELYPEDWTVKKGHRLALLLAQSDDEWFTPVPTQQTAQIAGGSLSIPFLRFTRPDVFNTKPTETEGQRPDPFEMTADWLGSTVKLEVPPALKKAPAAVRRTLKVSVRIHRMAKRRVVVSGSAPSGTRLVVRLRLGKRTIATKRTRAHGKRYRAVFRVRRAGRYRAAVSAQGSSVRATSGAVRVR
jgi:uncharacterized protein